MEYPRGGAACRSRSVNFPRQNRSLCLLLSLLKAILTHYCQKGEHDMKFSALTEGETSLTFHAPSLDDSMEQITLDDKVKPTMDVKHINSGFGFTLDRWTRPIETAQDCADNICLSSSTEISCEDPVRSSRLAFESSADSPTLIDSFRCSFFVKSLPVRCLFPFSPPDRVSRGPRRLLRRYKDPLPRSPTALTAFYPLIYSVTALCPPLVAGWAAEPP